MISRLYVGHVRHRRFAPKSHDFSYHTFMLYLDLEEIDRIFDPYWFWSAQSPNLAWFRRQDYLGGSQIPLREAVTDTIIKQGGPKPRGPIRMLTHLRYFGYCFNPVTFYYCLHPDSQRVESIVAEITNTPWQERKAYVLSSDLDEPRGPMHRYQFLKSFHVSPFFPMDLEYDWHFSDPGKRLNVQMNLKKEGIKVFDATLKLEERAINSWELARVLMRFPPETLKVIGGIYFEALRLKWKGIPVYDHPGQSVPPH